MATREDIHRRIQEDNIEFLLAQFVDIHGSPKVKMVPVSHLDDIIDVGAGFAGAAVPGMGQGPHSHDMAARVDLDPFPGPRALPVSPPTCTWTTSPTCTALART